MYGDLILKYSNKFKLEPKLVESIIQTESSFNRFAVRYEPRYRWTYSVKELASLICCTRETMESMQKTSWGLFQIMGAVAYEIGLRTWATKLIDPEFNIMYGCEFLNRIITSKGLVNPRDIYDVYNSGRVDRDDSNEKNVDRFMKIYESK